MTPDEFDRWFAKHMRSLNADQDGGFAVLMIALPLLERYLREKSGCFEGNLDTRFHTEFVNMFPNLSTTQSEEFWQCYRNGLLHQATFSEESRSGRIMPRAWISSAGTATPEIINYDSVTKEFVLLPKEFSEKVEASILADFSAFLGPGSSHHPPPKTGYPNSWSASSKIFGTDDFLPPASGTR